MGAFQEVVVFDRPTSTLLVTDLVVSVPSTPPAILAENDVRDRMTKIETEAYDAARENGMTVYELSDAEVTAWMEAAQPVYDQFLADSGDLGAKVLTAARALGN